MQPTKKVDGIVIPTLRDGETVTLSDYISRNAPPEIQKRLMKRDLMKKKNLEEQDDKYPAGKPGAHIRKADGD